MRTENEFNQHLRSNINLELDVTAFKVSDRFYVGAADWLVFSDGKAIAIECKFIKKVKSRGKLLQHAVSGPQVTYMRKMERAGVPGWILIGVGEERKMYLAYWEKFADGNIDVKEFRSYLDDGEIFCYEMGDVSGLLDGLF